MQQQVLIKQQNKVDGMMSLNPYQFDQVKVRSNVTRMVILHEYYINTHFQWFNTLGLENL